MTPSKQYASASGARSIVSPNLDGMAQLCEWAEDSIAQAMKDIPSLRGGDVRTWFHASQDFESGRLTITLYWSIVCEEGANG